MRLGHTGHGKCAQDAYGTRYILYKIHRENVDDWKEANGDGGRKVD